MTDEPAFSRPVNSDPVKFSTRMVPERRVLTETVVQLEPLDPNRHGDAPIERATMTSRHSEAGSACLGDHSRAKMR